MTQTDPAIAEATITPAFDPDQVETINTRFGDLTIDKDRIVTFVEGLYGLEQHRHYMLTSVPDWPDSFKLLQAVADPQLSLIVLPLECAGGPIDRDDIDEACSILGFDEDATIILGIVTMRADGESQVFTVNLKAPVLVDTARRVARQHVFASDKYRLRHVLPMDAQDEGLAGGE